MQVDKSTICPLCGSERINLRFTITSNDVTFSVCQCEDCHFVFNGLAEIESQNLNKSWDDQEMVITRDISFPYDRVRARKRLKVLRKFRNLKGKRILEVGSGSGAFLYEAKESGGQPTGIEIAEEMQPVWRKHLPEDIPIFTEPVANCTFPVNHFDVVVAFHTFEHIMQPHRFLEAIHHLLKPSGFLYFAVPNVESWQARFYGKRWNLYVPDHVSSFSPETIRRFLEKHEFRVKRLWTEDGGHFWYNLFLHYPKEMLRRTLLTSLQDETIRSDLRRKEEHPELGVESTKKRLALKNMLLRLDYRIGELVGKLLTPIRMLQNRLLSGAEINVIAVK